MGETPSAPSAGAGSAKAGSKKPRFQIASRAALKRLGVLFAIILLGLVYCYFSMIRMPGVSHRGPPPALSESQAALAEQLRKDVTSLAYASDERGPGVERVGNRSTFYPKRFAEAARFLCDRLNAIGFAEIGETFVERGSPVPNLEVIVPGTSRPNEIVVVGAHYDCFQGTPGADDNASGVAACLALAEVFLADPQPRTIRFVFFVNEEPPAFWTRDMGSWVYARKCRAAADNITAMISLESIGYYSDKPGSQRYPQPLASLYPDTADFIGFVGNWSSRGITRRSLSVFRERAQFPSEGAAPPTYLPGVGFSDHWSFWQEGYPAFMVTDTAMFRNPYYHTPNDKPETLDYERMARVVEGLEHVVRDLASQD